MTDPVDVLVVGSGAGGATVAWALAERGVRVEVLEKGPRRGLPDFLDKDEIRHARRDFFVPFPSEEPHLIRRGEGYERSADGWTSCCVGGGTVHMGGFFFRLHPLDFEERSRLGAPEGSTVADWPISYEELEPFYAEAERLIGVSGEARAHPFAPPRSGPLPLPPLLEHPLSRALDAAAKGLGWQPTVTPRAVLSRPYDGRAPCNYNGFCGSYGCETGAKGSVLFTFVPKAEATGRCRFTPGVMVQSILTNAAGKVTGVRCLNAAGQLEERRARVVILSCSSVESARLLLNSHPQGKAEGLANGSGLVGKNLSFSTFAQVEAELLRGGGGKGISGFDDRLPWLGRSVLDFYARGPRFPHRKGGTLRFDLIHPNPIFRAERVALGGPQPRWGAELSRALGRHFLEGRSLECEVFTTFSPSAGSYVDVSPDVKDRFGLPVARIHAAPLPEDVAASEALAAKAHALFTAMKADHVETRAAGGVTWVLQHGTCRFGDDPGASVLDRDCRSHEIDNLYVVDGSFMPSSGGVPTTLTIQANAIRVGRKIAEAMVKREL